MMLRYCAKAFGSGKPCHMIGLHKIDEKRSIFKFGRLTALQQLSILTISRLASR